MNRISACMLGGILAGLLAVSPAMAQEDKEKDTEKAQREAERQMHDTDKAQREAERQMRDAERQMREAQRQISEAARKLAELATRQGMRVERRAVTFSSKPRLGVVLKQEHDPKSREIGAVVDALTPGGPAEEAGLQAGDIIVTFNGERLADARVDHDEDESAATAKLIELSRGLKENDKVALEVRRGALTKTITVTAHTLGPGGVRVMTIPRVSVSARSALPALGQLDFLMGGPWGDVELVSLNPDLGDYFGAKEGVLIVRGPKDPSFKLRSGDVILSIGGRAPSSPTQALRILRSYNANDSIDIEVMRKRERVKVAIQMPADKRLLDEMTWTPEVPEPPETPEPPEVPEPPKHPQM
jgi:S1-C subfamily serine protease